MKSVMKKKTVSKKKVSLYNHKESDVLKATNLGEKKDTLFLMSKNFASIVFNRDSKKNSQEIEKVENLLNKFKLDNHALAFVLHSTMKSIEYTVRIVSKLDGLEARAFPPEPPKEAKDK